MWKFRRQGEEGKGRGRREEEGRKSGRVQHKKRKRGGRSMEIEAVGKGRDKGDEEGRISYEEKERRGETHKANSMCEWTAVTVKWVRVQDA